MQTVQGIKWNAFNLLNEDVPILVILINEIRVNKKNNK